MEQFSGRSGKEHNAFLEPGEINFRFNPHGFPFGLIRFLARFDLGEKKKVASLDGKSKNALCFGQRKIREIIWCSEFLRFFCGLFFTSFSFDQAMRKSSQFGSFRVFTCSHSGFNFFSFRFLIFLISGLIFSFLLISGWIFPHFVSHFVLILSAKWEQSEKKMRTK